MRESRCEKITFVADDGQEIDVPKFLLIKYSTYFHAKFAHEIENPNATTRMKIEGYTFEVVETVVNLVLNHLTKINNQQMALELFKFADFYGISRIKFAVVEYLIKNDGHEAIKSFLMEVFADAERQNSKKMLMIVLKYVMLNEIDVTSLVNFEKLDESQINLLQKSRFFEDSRNL